MGVASGVLALWPESGPAPGVGPPRMASEGSGPVAAPPYGCGQIEAPALAIGPPPPVWAVGRLPLPVWCSQWGASGEVAPPPCLEVICDPGHGVSLKEGGPTDVASQYRHAFVARLEGNFVFCGSQ